MITQNLLLSTDKYGEKERKPRDESPGNVSREVSKETTHRDMRKWLFYLPMFAIATNRNKNLNKAFSARIVLRFSGASSLLLRRCSLPRKFILLPLPSNRIKGSKKVLLTQSGRKLYFSRFYLFRSLNTKSTSGNICFCNIFEILLLESWGRRFLIQIKLRFIGNKETGCEL